MEKAIKRITAVTLIAVMTMCVIMAVGTTEAEAASKPGKPSVSVAKNNRKVTLKWKKVKNAKKYQIYRKIGTKKWKKIKTIKAGNKKSFKYSTTVKLKTRYYFKVRGLNGKKTGKFSKEKKVYVAYIVPKQVTFHGETFKITSDGEKLNYTNKNGVKEWFGATSDGLYAHYYEKNGKVDLEIAPEDEYGNKTPDMRMSSGYIDIHTQGITWGFDKSDMSVSFTLDGSNPTKGIGDINGKTYFTKELSGKFSIGKIGRYNLETITKGSYATDGQFNYGALLNPDGLNEQYYQPVSDTNPDGSHVILENGKSYWGGYSRNSFRAENVKTSTPVKVWVRVYEGNKRVVEKYVDVIPDLA